uniref:Uncharacterized protein n=1 Tax=Aegilops tauschii subsp. strangulata TaxID=200361 RepID=A0A453M7D3_AEGTS
MPSSIVPSTRKSGLLKTKEHGVAMLASTFGSFDIPLAAVNRSPCLSHWPQLVCASLIVAPCKLANNNTRSTSENPLLLHRRIA